MPTNLAIDDDLLEQALQVGGQKTKRATVTMALQEFIQRREQQRIITMFGSFDWDPSYDHREQRRRK
jgi:Arc/MetJ family transcription regulator